MSESGYLAALRVRIMADIENLRSRLTDAERLMSAFRGAAVASLLAISTAAFAAGLAIDDALDTIRIGTGATGSALSSLEADFSRTFAGVPDGADRASQAIADLNTRTGQTGPGLQELATQVLTLSRITKTDLTANVAGATRAFGDWGIAAAQQADTLDMVFRASQATGIGVDTLLAKLVQYGAPLRQLGFSFEEAAALMGKFEKEGVNAELVLGSLRIALGNFAKEGKNAPRALKDTIDRIQALGPSTAATALAIATFGKRAGPDMAAAILEGRFAIDGLVEHIANGTDTIAAAAADTDGFSESLAILRNRVTQALEPFGTRILDVFNRAIVALMENGQTLAMVLYRVGQAVVLLASILLGRLVPGIIAATVAAAANAAAFVVMAARMGVVALAARGLAGVLALLRGALAFFGGPIGLAVTTVLSAIGLGWLDAGRKSREGARMMEESAQRAANALAIMSDAAVTEQFVNAVESSAVWERRVREQQATFDALEARRAAGEAMTRMEQLPASQQRPGGEAARRVATDFGMEWQAAQTRLRDYNAELAKSRTAQEQAGSESARRIQQQAQLLVAAAGDLGGGAGAAEAAEKGKRFVEILRARATLLAEVFEAERAHGRDTAAVVTELTALYDVAAARLRTMGDAASLPAEALQDYRELLGIVTQMRELGTFGVVGPAEVRAARAPMLPAQVPDLSFSAAPGYAQQAGRILTAHSARWRAALIEGAEKAAERLKAASEDVRGRWAGLLNGLPRQVADFAGMFAALGVERRAEARMGQPHDGASALPPIPGAAAFVVLMEMVSGVAETLGPALAGLLYPVRLIGEALGTMLLPVVKLLFQPLRLLAIAVTYLQTAIGWAVRGIGKMIDKIPGISGGPLIRAGQSMMDGAEAVRQKLLDLSFDEAVNQAANAERASRSIVNAVEGFKTAAYRFRAQDARAVAPAAPIGPAPAPQPGAPTGGQPQSVVYQGMQVPVTIHTSGDGRETYRAWWAEVQRLARSNPAMRAFAESLAAPA
jgi:hypothetical protein